MNDFSNLCQKEFGRSPLWTNTKNLRGDMVDRLNLLMNFLTKLQKIGCLSVAEFRNELSSCRIGMEKKERLSSKKAERTKRSIDRIRTSFRIVRTNIAAIPRDYNHDKISGNSMNWVAEKIEADIILLENRLKKYRESLERGRNKLKDRTEFREVSSLIIFYRRLLSRAEEKKLSLKTLADDLKIKIPANAVLKFTRLSKQDYTIALLVLYTCECFWPNYGISPHRIAELVRVSSRK